MRGRITKRRAQEGLELSRRHLAGGHDKVFVLDRAEPGDIPSDRDIPGRIGEDHLRALVPEQAPIAFRRQGVAAQKAVLVEEPEIVKLGDRRGNLVERRQVVLFVAGTPREGDVNRPGFPAPTIPRLFSALARKLMVCRVYSTGTTGLSRRTRK